MKFKLIVLPMAIIVVLAPVLAGCGSSRVITLSTTPATTTVTSPITSTVLPTTTTTSPSTTTPVTTTTPSTTGTTTNPSAKTLTAVAIAVKPDTHPDAYNTVCLICHAEGMGINQYPMAPTWAGSALTPGPWQVVKGSDQDHTGRTDVTTCLTQAGCHVKGK